VDKANTFYFILFTQLQDSEEKKEGDEEEGEKKDDSIVYADLDKSAMSEGNHLAFNTFFCETNFFCRQ